MTRIFHAAAMAIAVMVIGIAPALPQRYGYQRPQGAAPQVRGGVPGRFDYYALVLSWSPTYCAENSRPNEEQCGRTNRPYAFVLHGLWPQYERGFPDSCPTSDNPYVTNRTIDGIIGVMPSRPLVIHEYRRHGVCSGMGPEQYFAFARRAFEKVKIPPRFASPDVPQTIDTNAVIGEFVNANPGLRPDMLAVACGGSGNRLKEVRICLTKEGEFRPCGGNEVQRRLCNAPRVSVPPVRAGGGMRTPSIPRQVPPPGPSMSPLAPGTRSL